MTCVHALAGLVTAVVLLAACSRSPDANALSSCSPRCGDESDAGGKTGAFGTPPQSPGDPGPIGGGADASASETSAGPAMGGSDAGAEPDSSAGSEPDATTTTGGGDDAGGPDGSAPTSYDASDDGSYEPVGGADVQWGQPCIYNFGSQCPFPIQQECGNHQGINVTFPNGPQLLNATLFAGEGCSPNALNDNLNDRQTTMGTGIWFFTDDADVAGVSASYATSAIWWVGPLTGAYPPAGAPTTGCINYTIDTPMCQ